VAAQHRLVAGDYRATVRFRWIISERVIRSVLFFFIYYVLVVLHVGAGPECQ
jgi:hypothetical protein